ncbi:hypothetical protein M9H77_31463 [Catharanthus roseus]|uniref:Uncharacterized protein n=1 Tax=Catharanthus roseus TaxID=4058 RepID=A0ACC0A133_CATRO|nr:hypothetical protein M9H77_31463 [Catharanthus roseus]
MDLFSYFLEVIYSLISQAAWFTSATPVCWRILRPSALTIGVVIGNDHTYWATQHASHVEVCHQWRQHIRDGPVLPEVDDMATGVIQGPPSSPTQIASFAKKVQTVIHKCMVSISVQPSRRRPSEPEPDGGTRRVKRSAHRMPGGRVRGEQAPAPPHPGRQGHADRVEEREGFISLTLAFYFMYSGFISVNNDKNDHSNKNYAVSSESDDDDNTDAREEDIQTPINPVIENTVTQWQSSQWFNSERYDYIQSKTFLDMG